MQQQDAAGGRVQSTDLGEVGGEDAPLSPQLARQPSLLAGLGDVYHHVPHPDRELVSRVALEVHQHQDLCRGGPPAKTGQRE